MSAFLLLFFLLLHSPTPTTSLKPLQTNQACKATRFPSSCLSTLSQSPPILTPTSLISTLLSSSLQSLTKAQSLIHSILNSSSSNPARLNAANNCIHHLTLSSNRLSASIQNPPLSRSIVSAALLYQYDCWSALKYVNSTHQVATTMSFLADLTETTSNALAMIVAYRRFGDDINSWIPPQTERDGYWEDNSGSVDDGTVEFPDNLSPDITVCKTGECEYQTVGDAVAAAPVNSDKHFVIYVKAGVYSETVRIPYEKTNVVFVGDGMGKTVITGALNAQMDGVTTYNTATVGVAGDGFMAKDLTFENSAGPVAHQAVAFMCDSDKSVMDSVEFVGHQDTLYARSLRQVYNNCRISGNVDFIFGNSASVFMNCDIVVVPRQTSPEKGETNAVTAHGRTDPGQATGFVFRNCRVNGSEEYLESYQRKPMKHKVYLGRPWKEYSRTVFLGCYLGEMVRSEGWLPWTGEFALKTLFYGESGSWGPGGDVKGRVDWSSQIAVEHLGVYSLKNFLRWDE